MRRPTTLHNHRMVDILVLLIMLQLSIRLLPGELHPSSTSCDAWVPVHSVRRPTRLLAKKKKKGNNKKSKQTSGFAWASSFTLAPDEASDTRALAELAVGAYRGIAGRHLSADLETSNNLPRTLWKDSVACIIMGTSDENTPMVQYANVAALETLGVKEADFEQVFSTNPNKEATSAPIVIPLPAVLNGDKKLESGYRKTFSLSSDIENSETITILEAKRWVLEKSMLLGGKFVTESIGVVYAWEEWMTTSQTEEGGEVSFLCRPGGVREQVEDLGDLDERIAAQANLVRDLKETQGFGNKDEPVVEAVEELLRLKALKEG